MRLVADYAEREALADCTVKRALTLQLLARLFGQAKGKKMSEIAESAGVSVNTATNHLSRLKLWLLGNRVQGGALEGQEAISAVAAHWALANAGIVGASEDTH